MMENNGRSWIMRRVEETVRSSERKEGHQQNGKNNRHLAQILMDTSPTMGSVTTTAEDKRWLAKSSVEFNCKNQPLKYYFQNIVKYEEQLAVQQSVEHASPALIEGENSVPSLKKRGAKEEPSDVKSPQKLNSHNHRQRSFPSW